MGEKIFNSTWDAVEEFFGERLIGPDEALAAALADTRAAGMPEIAVSAAQGKLLNLLARLAGARSVLEIGTLGGYSTIWLARSGARVVTLEADADYASAARANIASAGFEDAVDLRVGPALETLQGLDGPFDLIFIDADKPSNAEYFVWALELSRPGTLIIVDNVVRGGEVVDPDNHDPRTLGVHRLNDVIAAEPRVSATAVQTVGRKGHDGFVLALVNDL
jgi:predicted O-methyltransferase YrrM